MNGKCFSVEHKNGVSIMSEVKCKYICKYNIQKKIKIKIKKKNVGTDVQRGYFNLIPYS